MTLHTIIGTPLRQDEILNQFFEEVTQLHGWKVLGQAMDWVQIMEEGHARYYLVGSRALGLSQPSSDLDVFTDATVSIQDFQRGGVDLKKFFWEAKNPVRLRYTYVEGWHKPAVRNNGDEEVVTSKPNDPVRVVYEEWDREPYSPGNWKLARLGSVLEVQLRRGFEFRKKLWETVLQKHKKDLERLSKASKKKRRRGQNRLFSRLAAKQKGLGR